MGHLAGLRRSPMPIAESPSTSLVPPRPPVDVAGFVEPGSEAARLFRELDLERLPRHVAIIMDGNGRWARSRGLPRTEGHKRGADSVRTITRFSRRIGIRALTL